MAFPRASSLFRENKRPAWVFAACPRKDGGQMLSEVTEAHFGLSGNACFAQVFTIQGWPVLKRPEVAGYEAPNDSSTWLFVRTRCPTGLSRNTTILSNFSFFSNPSAATNSGISWYSGRFNSRVRRRRARRTT
jgi:hypothetical protein